MADVAEDRADEQPQQLEDHDSEPFSRDEMPAMAKVRVLFRKMKGGKERVC